MIGKVFQSLLNDDITGLQISTFLCQSGQVVIRFIDMRSQSTRGLEKSPGLVHIALSQFQDAQVVEGLCVVVVGGQGQSEALVGKSGVSDLDGDVADVVPDFA